MGGAGSIEVRKAEVRRRLSLAAVIEPHVKLSGSRGSARRRGRCPFHGSNSASLALFDADKGSGGAFCFGCQWQGDLFGFLMDFHGWDFLTALAEAEAMAGCADASGAASAEGRGTLQRARNPARRRDRAMIEPIAFARAIWRLARPDAGAATRYFRGRGVPAAALTPARLAAFRYLAECPVSLPREGDPLHGLPNAPALMALVVAPPAGADGPTFQPVGLHVTYLAPGGEATMVRRKPWARADDPDPLLPKRRMLGPVGGGAVLLGAYDRQAPLYVGEGNETVLSAIGMADDGGATASGYLSADSLRDPAIVGVATLSLDNLQGGMRLWRNRVWPLFDVQPDPARPCFTIPGHRGPVIGLVDSDMGPLRGKRDRDTGAFLGEAVVERKGGPIVRRAITGAERARICGELVVRAWRRAGASAAAAVRAPAGMDFNDAARAAEAEATHG